MVHSEMKIETQDGQCPTHVFHPDGDGTWPAVIMYMDGIGMRPALEDIGARIASDGYYVLLPDLFYRVGFDGRQGAKVWSDPVARADLMTRVMPSASAANVMRDTDTFLTYLADQPNVEHDKLGFTGYCMGGRLSLYAAGHYGDRVQAAASYHGGRLATDDPDSPHRLAPQMRARVYVAGAIEDASFDDAQKARLERALDDAGVEHTVETYEARHGFVPSDTPAHDEAAEQRHWATLFSLFNGTLKTGTAQ